MAIGTLSSTFLPSQHYQTVPVSKSLIKKSGHKELRMVISLEFIGDENCSTLDSNVDRIVQTVTDFCGHLFPSVPPTITSPSSAISSSSNVTDNFLSTLKPLVLVNFKSSASNSKSGYRRRFRVGQKLNHNFKTVRSS